MKYLVFLLAVFPFLISAQNKSDTLYLTLNEAINKALIKNWDVQISHKDIDKSQSGAGGSNPPTSSRYPNPVPQRSNGPSALHGNVGMHPSPFPTSFQFL